ncbi:MAG: RNA polymerase sigma factor [Planctomycetia bacterium]
MSDNLLTQGRRGAGGPGMSADDRLREAMLRRAVLAGDEAAWRRWYDEQYEPLRRFAQWRCGRRADWTDEVVQETWLTAVRRIAAFDPNQASFADWLRGIAVNHLRNLLRGRNRRCEEPLPDTVVDPRGAEVDDESAAVAETLDRLSAKHEAVLRAKYLDGWSVARIASEWCESEKAVESLLTRARAAFRDGHRRPDDSVRAVEKNPIAAGGKRS